jgi:hypothetical protein
MRQSRHPQSLLRVGVRQRVLALVVGAPSGAHFFTHAFRCTSLQDAAAQEQLVAVIGIMLEETLRINVIGMSSTLSSPISEKTMFEEPVLKGDRQCLVAWDYA